MNIRSPGLIRLSLARSYPRMTESGPVNQEPSSFQLGLRSLISSEMP